MCRGLGIYYRRTEAFKLERCVLVMYYVWSFCEPSGVDPPLVLSRWSDNAFVDFVLSASAEDTFSSPFSGPNGPGGGGGPGSVGGQHSVTTQQIIQSGRLPNPQMGIIGEIEKAIRALARTPAAKERICEYIQQEEYVRAMIDVFHVAEELENVETLHALCSCMQTIRESAQFILRPMSNG